MSVRGGGTTARIDIRTGRPMARRVSLFTGQWADLPLTDLASRGAGVRLRRARAGLLGGPPRRRAGGGRPRLLPDPARRAGHPRPRVLGHLAPSGRAARLRSERRSVRRLRAGRPRRRSGGEAPLGNRGDAGRGARRTEPRRAGRLRLHGVADLASALRVSAGGSGRRGTPASSASPTCGIRSSTSSRSRACASPSRCIRRRIAFDIVTAHRALDAIGRRDVFGFNFDPSHLKWQGMDPVRFIDEFPDRIYHVHMKDVAVTLDGRSGIPVVAPRLRCGGPGVGLSVGRPWRRRLRGDSSAP